MGAKRQAKKELEKERELAKLRAKQQNKQAAKARQAAARQAKLAAMTPEERTAFLARERKTKLITAGVVVAVIAVLAIIGSVMKQPSSTGGGGGGGVDTSSSSACAVACIGDSGDVPSAAFGAFDVCKQFVTERLKAPSGATWRDPIGNQVTYTGSGDGPWTVDASVDSENSFGAKLRSTYTCTVMHASGDSWTLVSLNLNDGGAS